MTTRSYSTSLAVALALVLALTAVIFALHRAQTGSGASLSSIGGSFDLIDTGGLRVSDATFRGAPSAFFFGFTHCPDACPTTLTMAGQWLEELGDVGDKIRFVFVSVDPERDTPAALRDYMEAFDRRILALTGTRAQVDNIVKKFRVYVRKVPLDGGDYTVDHTASVFLMGPGGDLVGTISFQETNDIALAKLRRLGAM